MKKLIPTEHDEQVALFQWRDVQICIYPVLAAMYAIPNQRKWGDNYKSWSYFKAEGFEEGMPDVVLPCKNQQYSGLYIEMKRSTEKNIKDGGLTKSQLEKKALLNRIGNLSIVCYSFEEARDAILSYLANREQHECVLVNKNINCIQEKIK